MSKRSHKIENRRIASEKNRKSKEGNRNDYFDGKRAVKKLGCGDSFYIPNLVKTQHAKDEIFADLISEVQFKQMFNFGKSKKKNNEIDVKEAIPRLITAQTNKETDTFPIYRMPGCNESNIQTTNWSPTVEKIRKLASETIGEELNHCVVTLFRDENDSLGFHCDKLLDLRPNSLILSISFGAPRPIVFRKMANKGKAHRQTIMLQSGSLLAIGPKTNVTYQHSIPKLSDECQPRISLSMRSVSTFHRSMADNGDVIIGNGSEYQTTNYPFIQSYDNPIQYSKESKQQIKEAQTSAQLFLTELSEKLNSSADN